MAIHHRLCRSCSMNTMNHHPMRLLSFVFLCILSTDDNRKEVVGLSSEKGCKMFSWEYIGPIFIFCYCSTHSRKKQEERLTWSTRIRKESDESDVVGGTITTGDGGGVVLPSTGRVGNGGLGVCRWLDQGRREKQKRTMVLVVVRSGCLAGGKMETVGRSWCRPSENMEDGGVAVCCSGT
jgi:hypothetical protein